MAENGSDEQPLSPLSLLLEQARRSGQRVEEALFLTYTLNLGFFERFVLGPAQASGARVSIIGDARMAVTDPYSARRWGRSYFCSLADAAGAAFHPKLLVLAGRDHAAAVIGSGNLTLAGWADNSELWTVVRGGSDGAPALFGELAAWLRALPHARVTLTDGARESLHRTAELLAAFPCEDSEDRIRLVSGLERPIIEQLPHGPVDELSVFAPFHDQDSAGLTALVDRLQPSRLIVAYQPGYTDLDGPSLAAAVERAGGEVRADHEKPYRHGKLVEWRIGPRRWALTGSPNISRRALLLDQRSGGNCELGVIAPIGATLLPPCTAEPLEQVRLIRSQPHQAVAPGPVLLGAELAGNGVQVLLNRPLREPGELRISPPEEPPEHWQVLCELVPGQGNPVAVPARVEGGSRLQFVGPGPVFSNIIAVNDRERLAKRPTAGTDQLQNPRPEELWNDPQLAEKYFAELERISAEHTGRTPPGASGTRPPLSSGSRPQGRTDPLDMSTRTLGTALLNFALGRPAPAQEPSDDSPDLIPVPWDEEIENDFAAGLEGDDAADFTDASPDQPARGKDPKQPDRKLAKQRAARKIIKLLPGLEPVIRLAALRMALILIADGAWSFSERAWIPLLAEGAATLAGTDADTSLESHAGSLAAVVLSILRGEVPRHHNAEENLAIKRTAKQISHLLVAAEPGLVEEYGQHLEGRFGNSAAPETVIVRAEEFVQADPVADAIGKLTDQNLDAHRHPGPLLHVHGRFANPHGIALRAVSAVDKATLTGAWATNDTGAWALAIWRPPDLITIQAADRTAAPLWRQFRLSGLVTLPAAISDPSLLADRRLNHGRLTRPFPLAEELLTSLSLSAPSPPEDCPEHGHR